MDPSQEDKLRLMCVRANRAKMSRKSGHKTLSCDNTHYPITFIG